MASNVNRKGFCKRCNYIHKRDQHNDKVIQGATNDK